MRAAVSECLLLVVGAAVYEKEASAGAPNVIPDAYWFSEEDGVETAVFGNLWCSGDVILGYGSEEGVGVSWGRGPQVVCLVCGCFHSSGFCCWC